MQSPAAHGTRVPGIGNNIFRVVEVLSATELPKSFRREESSFGVPSLQHLIPVAVALCPMHATVCLEQMLSHYTCRVAIMPGARLLNSIYTTVPHLQMILLAPPGQGPCSVHPASLSPGVVPGTQQHTVGIPLSLLKWQSESWAL